MGRTIVQAPGSGRQVAHSKGSTVKAQGLMFVIERVQSETAEYDREQLEQHLYDSERRLEQMAANIERLTEEREALAGEVAQVKGLLEVGGA